MGGCSCRHPAVSTVVRSLLPCRGRQVIDLNFYPVPEARTSNMRHRPIGMGVQGLADAFVKMRMPYESPEAAQLNRDIFETMYFAALDGTGSWWTGRVSTVHTQ